MRRIELALGMALACVVTLGAVACASSGSSHGVRVTWHPVVTGLSSPISVTNAGVGAGFFAAAGFLAVLAIIMLSVAIACFINWNGHGVDLHWAFLIVFGCYLLIAGPLDVELWCSTTGTDSDFVVKLIDVFPDSPNAADQPGFQMMVRSEVIRGRYRNSFEKPEAFVPGEPARIKLELLDVLHSFKKGHRLMIQVQSTWFPLVDRNPQRFMKIAQARPDDFRRATHRVYHMPGRASRLTMSVVSSK